MELLKSEPLPLPPPAEQAAIVRFLDWASGRLERAIRAKRKVIALLNERKQAIIHRAVTRGLDPSVPLKPSGIPWLGDIPQHWETPLFGRLLAGVEQGWSPVAAEGELALNQWAVLTLSSVRRGVFNPAAIKPVSLTADVPREIEVFDGDVLLTRSNMGIDVRPSLMLRNFTPDESREVIQECASEEALSLTDELIETIVTDLTKEGRVRPPELQIVCTALTANFTARHYKELGGAKGILESYLALTIDTSPDQHVARLLLRQMCDFERRTKADPRTVDELVQAVDPRRDNLETNVKLVQRVLDHFARSRLAVVVAGKHSLIHDYWVSLIYDATIHDRSEQEKANELLRRHLHELETGIPSVLGSSQLRLVLRFASQDLCSTNEATLLLRKSSLRLWFLRGITACAFIALAILSFLSSSIIWQVTQLADNGPDKYFSRHLLRNTGLLVLEPQEFGRQERSSISLWNIKNGTRESEVIADAWALSPQKDTMLYSDSGRAYVMDLQRNSKSALPRTFEDGSNIDMSKSAHCALYSPMGAAGSSDDAPSREVQLWSLPEGKLLATALVKGIDIADALFVSDTCYQTVFTTNEGASIVVSGNTTSSVDDKKRIWIWTPGKAQPESLPMLVQTAAVDEASGSIIGVKTYSKGMSSLFSWDLQSGRPRLRPLDFGADSRVSASLGQNGKFAVLVSYKLSDMFKDSNRTIEVVRTADLQESPLTKGRRLVQCQIARTDGAQSPGFVLWSVSGQGGYIWDASGNDPLALKSMDDVSDVVECNVSFDRSFFVLVRKVGSAELWSLQGNKVADLRVGVPIIRAQWTLQGTSVALQSSAGDTTLVDLHGSPIAKLAPFRRESASMMSTDHLGDVSFEPACGNVFVWTPDGRVLKYTKRLKVLDLPYAMPLFWHRPGSTCEN